MPDDPYLWPEELLPPALSEPEDPVPVQSATTLERAVDALILRQSVSSMRPAWLGTIYLIHFDAPLHHAQHYLGWTAGRLEKRLAVHGSDEGARLMQVITEQGITWRLVRIWENVGRSVESHLKARHNSRRLCPLCEPAALRYAMQR